MYVKFLVTTAITLQGFGKKVAAWKFRCKTAAEHRHHLRMVSSNLKWSDEGRGFSVLYGNVAKQLREQTLPTCWSDQNSCMGSIKKCVQLSETRRLTRFESQVARCVRCGECNNRSESNDTVQTAHRYIDVGCCWWQRSAQFSVFG